MTKRETYEKQLLELLADIDPSILEVNKQVNAKQGKLYEITEDEIQDFREAQGIIYFLKAPELFQYKLCKHCGEEFLVSRLYVAYCSYTCIRKEMEKDGLTWKKGYNIELLVQDPQVYDGQEPIWITKTLPRLKRALKVLCSETENSQTQPESKSLPLKVSQREKSGGTNNLQP